MPQDNDKIRQRAYEIWDMEGRQDGRADEHWLQAERELDASGTGAPGTTSEAPVPAKTKKRGEGGSRSAPVKAAEAAPRKGAAHNRPARPEKLPSYERPSGTGTRQMSSAYSRIVRSEENQPT